ncbi:MAG: SpoIID/LytB domain-containing protein [Thermodesulfobacteriota bacterium]
MPKKFFFSFLSITLASLTGIFIYSSAEGNSKKAIRVLISRDIHQLKIAGIRLTIEVIPSGRRLFINRDALTVFREKGPFLRLKEKRISGSGFVLTPAQGYLQILGRKYEGKITLYPGNNKDIWIINELPLEEYLVGLVNKEISSQWPLAAVKAQVVAARTYAYYQKEKRADNLFDVEATVNDQVYAGVDFEDERAKKAVRETAGEVILYQGKPIFAVYHACCGGKTESPAYLWSGDYPYLKSISCLYCLDSPHFLWNYQLEIDKLEKILQERGNGHLPIQEILAGPRNESQRITKIIIRRDGHDLEIPAPEFRQLLGYDQLRSTNFWVKKVNRTFSFAGLGWGHGVGLCQWGAKGMAETGADYQSIIKYYYQNVEIGKKF